MKIEDIIDRSELNERLDGDFELFVELTDIFLNDSKKLIQRIDNAIKTKDPDNLRKSAHTLKGAVSNFSALAAYNTALEMENCGRAEDLDQAVKIFQTLLSDINDLKEAMLLIRGENKI